VALCACGTTAPPSVTVPGSVLGSATTASPAPSSGATPDGQPTHTPDAFTALVLAATGGGTPAGSDLDRLWADVFAKVRINGAAPYAPPDAVLGYRAGQIPDTVCAAAVGAGYVLNNAKYCPADHRIVFDEDWLREIASRNGDLTALAILAHEWGHHAQMFMGVRSERPLQSELQADCLAAMYLTTSTLVPHGSVQDEDAAMLAAMTTMFELGNETYKVSEWFAASEHGAPQQRIMSVSTGLQSNQEIMARTGSMATGLPFCYGYRDFTPGAFAEIGPYRFLELPGRKASMVGDLYVVEAEARTGQPGSAVIMSWLAQLPQRGGATFEQMQAIWEVGYAGIQPIGDSIDLTGNVAPGTGIAQYYQVARKATDGTTTYESGLFSLVSPASGVGALLILVVRPEPAPTDPGPAGLAVIEEQLVTLYQVISRLCAPDQSALTTAPHFSPVCQQESQ
jgi:predicted metalloprotease